jgi:hypothetical protein
LGNVITNGDFETGAFGGWTQAGTTAIVNSPIHGGSKAARAGSTSLATSGNSSLSQTFNVPVGGGSLTFWYQVHCVGLSSSAWATATIHDNVTNGTTTVLAPTCTNTGLWVPASANLAAMAGHSVTLVLTSHHNGSKTSVTYALFDDVSLTAGPSPTPTPTPSPTPTPTFILVPFVGFAWVRRSRWEPVEADSVGITSSPGRRRPRAPGP